MKTLADLRPDPRNARRHTPRNVGMIEQALREVGAARSIVIDETGTVLAGNATIEAAAAAGIERVRVVETDGNEIVAVQRTGLSPTQKTRLALYDNRAAELAEWEVDTLKDLEADDFAGIFFEEEIDKLLAEPDVLHLVDDGERASGDGEPTPGVSRSGYPLAIVLDPTTHARWREYKQSVEIADDTKAFVELLGAVE